MGHLNQFLIYDELPFWSAPFGLTLFETIQLRNGINILDIGSGGGFPMLEIAERAGKTTSVYGIDPSAESIKMISKKIELKGISNAFITRGVAEELPFPDCFFGLIVGNNGINNVKDEYQVLSECRRVLEENGQMVLTMNLPYTFVEFYEIFEEVLLERGMTERTGNLKDHIFTKRKPVEYWKEAIEKAGFKIRSVNVDGFKMKFTDGNAFLEHNFIRAAFRKPWEKVASDPEIWQAIADKLNRVAAANGELTMSVPFACFDCYKS